VPEYIEIQPGALPEEESLGGGDSLAEPQQVDQ
jgi:hypothetical protein